MLARLFIVNIDQCSFKFGHFYGHAATIDVFQPEQSSPKNSLLHSIEERWIQHTPAMNNGLLLWTHS